MSAILHILAACRFEGHPGLTSASATPLSRFNSWNYGGQAEEGTEEYYSQQLYDNGAKCWNGPHRSVKVRRLSASLLLPAISDRSPSL